MNSRREPRRALRALFRQALVESFLVAIAFVSLGCASNQVERLVDGEVIDVRRISGRAYALYAEGVVRDTEGDFQGAAIAYLRSARIDTAHSDALVKLGALLCRGGHVDDAHREFDAAERRNAEFEPLWTERARCSLSASQMDQALAESAKAVALGPDSDEAVLLRAEVLEKSGDLEAAKREVVGLTLRHPSRVAFEREKALGEKLQDPVLVRIAEKQLGSRETLPAPSAPSLSSIDLHLKNGEVREAISEGRRLHLAGSEVLVRAASVGHCKGVGEEARLTALADRRDADAWVAAFACSGPNGARVLDVARGQTYRPAAPITRLLLEVLLRRQVGKDAASEGFEGDADGDALARFLREQLK